MLVLEMFIGKRPEGTRAYHNNGNMLDNHAENLSWLTPVLPTLPEIPHVEVRHVQNFPGYCVTSNGQVLSCKQKGRIQPSYESTWKVMGLYQTPVYLSLRLRKENKQYARYVHLLVLEAFRGPCPSSFQACHNNGNCLDNRLENLRWDTPASNQLDKQRHGTLRFGERCWQAKLTDEEVQYVLEFASKGMNYTEIGQRFNVAYHTIWDIVRGKTWKHIQSM